MVNAAYLILILVVAGCSIVAGFRRGITGQLASVLGFSFGAVAARVLTPEFIVHFEWTKHLSQAPEFTEFTANLICGGLIYFVVYCLFSLLNPLFRFAMSVVEVGMFNRLIGATFALVKNLLWLSLVFNFFLFVIPQSKLLRYESANDGNLVAAVMALTPAILGCYGAEDFAHHYQLREAKKISQNIAPPPLFIPFETKEPPAML